MFYIIITSAKEDM